MKAAPTINTTIRERLAWHRLDTGIPVNELRRTCLNAGLELLRRGELKVPPRLAADKVALTVTIHAETFYALEKLAAERRQSVEAAAAVELAMFASRKVELTSADFEEIADQVAKKEAAALSREGLTFAGAYVDTDTHEAMKAIAKAGNRTVASLCRKIFDSALSGEIEAPAFRPS